ncbi:hypothetical protein M0805_001512, partial [Coniferiporia weirii]
LGKQHERDNQEDGQNAGMGNAMRTAVGMKKSDSAALGKDTLVGEHPAMNVPDVESSSSSLNNKGPRDQGSDEPKEARPSNAAGEEMVEQERRTEQPAEPTSTPRDDTDSAVPDTNGSQANVDAAIPSSTSVDGLSGPELLRSDYDDAEQAHLGRVAAITEHLNATKFEGKGTATDDASMGEFRPHIMHAPHSPVPIAMVNRAPKGTPGHESVKGIPQNVAWLSAFKHAEKSIFIQTPTFNASPVIAATLDACRRGIEVTLYLDLGFNDLGEMIPFQGGTNEQVVNIIYKTLNAEGKQDNLKVYWYTAKDQSEPMNATKKERNCHVKFMSVDDSISILGNGNQDTQSWFHSQEVNVLVDSPALAAEWYAGINANQNTREHGIVDNTDGVWRARDGSGRVVESSGTKTTGPLGGLKGLSGAIKRVRGTGGF